jgi:hypothetical protein
MPFLWITQTLLVLREKPSWMSNYPESVGVVLIILIIKSREIILFYGNSQIELYSFLYSFLY